MAFDVQAVDVKDREETARFGATPIPGKIGMALGESRHFTGQPGVPNPNNRNVFVSNVSGQLRDTDNADDSSPSKRRGKI